MWVVWELNGLILRASSVSCSWLVWSDIDFLFVATALQAALHCPKLGHMGKAGLCQAAFPGTLDDFCVGVFFVWTLSHCFCRLSAFQSHRVEKALCSPCQPSTWFLLQQEGFPGCRWFSAMWGRARRCLKPSSFTSLHLHSPEHNHKCRGHRRRLYVSGAAQWGKEAEDKIQQEKTQQ